MVVVPFHDTGLAGLDFTFGCLTDARYPVKVESLLEPEGSEWRGEDSDEFQHKSVPVTQVVRGDIVRLRALPSQISGVI